MSVSNSGTLIGELFGDKMLKNKVAAGFSHASAQYDQYAVLQQISAAAMAQKINEIHPSLPVGSVLEIGCGTGAVTKVLARELPKRNIMVTDLSFGMVQLCRDNLLADGITSGSLQWAVADGEKIADNAHAFIVSALTMQWFEDLSASFAKMLANLLPGGVLLCSYVSSESFPEWRQICHAAKIPFTANLLPKADFYTTLIDQGQFEVEAWSKDLTISFERAKDFFLSLKKTGSGTSIDDSKLTISQLRRLIAAWDLQAASEQVEVTYVVSYLVVRKKI